MDKHAPKNGAAWPRQNDAASMTWRILIPIFLAAAVFAIYWQIQDYEYINFDDDLYVTDNEHVQEGLSSESLAWAFKAIDPYWHPAAWLSHMLDYQLYGINPAGHHLTSLLFHAANAILLFIVLARMTGAQWQSAFVAALFAVHPLNVESVAWIAERKNVLSAFFWLLTMWAYFRYAGKSHSGRASAGRYLLALLFFALGLMSKPILVTLPFVLLLLDYWPLGRLRLGKEKDGHDNSEKLSSLIWEKIPFLVLAFASSYITFATQKISGAVQSTEIYPLRGRIVNALVSYLEYLEKMVWPRELTVFYPHPWSALPVWKGAAAAIALACVTIAAVKMIRKAPYLAVGWFWFLGTLVPVIGIVQVGWQAMADRFAYIPLIGIFIAIAWGLPDLLATRRWRNKALAVSAGIIIPVFMAISWTQAGLWKNSVVLFKHTVAATDKKYPSFAMAHLTLGNALSKQKMMDEAIAQYKEAIRLLPYYLEPHYNLANILRQQGNYKEAAIHYRKTIRLKPRHAEAHNNLGNALSAEGRSQAAIISYQTAIWIKPNYTEAHYNLGMALARDGRQKEALAHYREAIRLKPNFANAYNNLGNILRKQGNFQEAIANFEAAIKIDPDFTLAHRNLKLALSLAGKPE